MFQLVDYKTDGFKMKTALVQNHIFEKIKFNVLILPSMLIIYSKAFQRLAHSLQRLNHEPNLHVNLDGVK